MNLSNETIWYEINYDPCMNAHETTDFAKLYTPSIIEASIEKICYFNLKFIHKILRCALKHLDHTLLTRFVESTP